MHQFLYAPVGEEDDVQAYVDLPEACRKEGVCVRLQYWFYRMRQASHGWEEEYTRRVEALGFKTGKASPCCFHREADGISCVVNGDEFVFEGEL